MHTATISEDWFIPVSEYRRTTRLGVFPTYPLANTNRRCASVFDAPATIWGFVPIVGISTNEKSARGRPFS